MSVYSQLGVFVPQEVLKQLPSAFKKKRAVKLNIKRRKRHLINSMV